MLTSFKRCDSKNLLLQAFNALIADAYGHDYANASMCKWLGDSTGEGYRYLSNVAAVETEAEPCVCTDDCTSSLLIFFFYFQIGRFLVTGAGNQSKSIYCART